MVSVEATIIGGGIVGCAVADAAARSGLRTVLLERESRLATVTTSRNSEVAHGGMYYPTGSWKARCCVRGRRLLKAFCVEAGVDFQECGKLIVAANTDESGALTALLERGLANGVEDLRLIEARELSDLAPDVTAAAALWSPATGIVDAEFAARAYAQRAAEHEAVVMTDTEVVGLAPSDAGWRVEARRGEERWTHESTFVVICGGLAADELAEIAGLEVDALGLRQRWVRGNYFGVDPRHAGRVRHLVYPLPPENCDTLGVHVCLDLAGQLRLGPDFEPIDRVEDYGVDPERRRAFFEGARRFLPWLEEADLSPALSGIRPKIDTNDDFADFRFEVPQGDRAGLVALAGIDSPGLTSAPALAELVTDVLNGGAPPVPWTPEARA